MVTFAMLSTCLDLEQPQFRRQLLQPSCAWKAVSILCTVLSAYSRQFIYSKMQLLPRKFWREYIQYIIGQSQKAEDCVNTPCFDPSSSALRAITLKRKGQPVHAVDAIVATNKSENEQAKRHFHANSGACF